MYISVYMFLFFAVYREINDLDDALFNDDVEGIFMERLHAYYYFNDKVNDDNLRVFHAVQAEISYKMALKINTACTFLKKNNCFRRRLEHPLIGSLIKRYTKPLKVLAVVCLFVSFYDHAIFNTHICHHPLKDKYSQ